MSTNRAGYIEEWRRGRIATGMCVKCIRPASKGRQSCARCAAKDRRRATRRRLRLQAEGLCTRCAKPSVNGLVVCMECRAIDMSFGPGICSQCRKRAADDGKLTCGPCRETRYSRNRERRADGICIKCGKNPNRGEGTVYCEPCCAYFRGRSKAKCQCNEPKDAKAKCCQTCARRDAFDLGPAAAKVLLALRSLGGSATMAAIVGVLDSVKRPNAGPVARHRVEVRAQRMAYRGLALLRDAGRVVRLEDADGREWTDEALYTVRSAA